MNNGPGSAHDKWKICVVFCLSDIAELEVPIRISFIEGYC